VQTLWIPDLTLRHRLGGYREYAAPAALAPICEAVWSYRMPPVGGDCIHRVLPDPAASIELSCRREHDGRPSDIRMLLIGSTTRPYVFGLDPGREMVAVRLKLEWTTDVLGLGPTDHRDTTIDLREVHAKLAASLEASFVTTATIDAAIASLVAVVTRHVTRQLSSTLGIAARALDVVRRTNGRCAIHRIADRMAVSERYLRRIVAREAGISLKTYARTVRLLHAVTMADASTTRRLSWAKVAADAGFSDQAHLIRECQALCGLTPGAVFRERRSEMDDAVATWGRSDTETPTPRSPH
jgi:AraC-like DNA-binding protein